jgi:hypothetical protein
MNYVFKSSVGEISEEAIFKEPGYIKNNYTKPGLPKSLLHH